MWLTNENMGKKRKKPIVENKYHSLQLTQFTLEPCNEDIAKIPMTSAKAVLRFTFYRMHEIISKLLSRFNS